jgi:hypothetical protein
MNLIQLRKELEKRKNRTGLVGTRLDLSEVEGNSMSAHITTDWKTISMQFGEELDLVPDRETKSFVEKKNIDNPKLKVGLDILDHEAGHREKPTGTRLGCPYTVGMHDAIKEAIHRALREKSKDGLEDYVTNAFEDVLDNVNCRKDTDFSGQTLFWNNQGLVNSESENGKYNAFYEAFVRINLILGGNVSDYTLLRRFFKGEDKVRTSVRGFLGDLGSRLGIERLVKLHEKSDSFERLFTTDLDQREELWTALAYSFALHTADLLDKKPQQMMFGAGENPFDKEMEMPKNKQEVAHKRYVQGKGPAEHRDVQDQLYDLYKRISRDIPVETSSYAESQGMPLVHYGRRFIGEYERKIRFRGVGIDKDGELNIRTSRHNIQFPVSFKVHPRQFPKFKLALVDRSTSMAASPDNGGNVGDTSFIPWGDNSKYHYALKGYFGVENFLERQGISSYVKSCVLGFSGEGAVKGDSRTVATSLLTEPSGGTSLDINGLERELLENALVLSISDGEMRLNSSIKERFENKIKQEGVDYAHVQIGGETEFSTFLKGIGVPVFTVRGDDDLSRTMISFVSGYYREPKGERV